MMLSDVQAVSDSGTLSGSGSGSGGCDVNTKDECVIDIDHKDKHKKSVSAGWILTIPFVMPIVAATIFYSLCTMNIRQSFVQQTQAYPASWATSLYTATMITDPDTVRVMLSVTCLLASLAFLTRFLCCSAPQVESNSIINHTFSPAALRYAGLCMWGIFVPYLIYRGRYRDAMAPLIWWLVVLNSLPTRQRF